MPDEIVITDSGDETSPEESSAHEAAVAEGAAAVHSGNAEEAAEEAKQAAEAGLAAAAANIAAAEAANDAADRAEQAAEQTGVTLDMLHEALSAQGSAITALTEEIRNSRKETKPKPADPVTHTKDEAPAPKKPKRRGFVMR